MTRTHGTVPVLAIATLGLAFCHPTDRPPVPPPNPTDPTLLASMAYPAPAEVIDASIVTDGGAGWDGAGFELDVMPASGHARSP